MDIHEIYKLLLNKVASINIAELKHTRKTVYKMTQKEFADLLGMRYSTYESWERERYKPSSPALALLHMAINYKDVFLHNRAQLMQKIGEYAF